MTRRVLVLIHFLFWLFKLGETYYFYELKYFEWHPLYFAKLFMLFGFTMAFSYLNYFVLVPVLLFKKRYFLYVIGVLTTAFAHFWILPWAWGGYSSDYVWPSEMAIRASAFATFQHFSVATLGRFMHYWWISEQTKRKLRQELRTAELQYLKSQVSPHFLFNTLNNIYGLSMRGAKQTPRAIQDLHDMMSYMKGIQEQSQVSLATEIAHIQNYARLHELRGQQRMEFSFNTQEAPDGISIPPALMQPFVENAFKHGDDELPIEVSLEVDKAEVNFRVVNGLKPSRKKDGVGGIGIQNVERRLSLLFPKKFDFEYGPEGKQFVVNLKFPVL